jgi:hypothetical protein
VLGFRFVEPTEPSDLRIDPADYQNEIIAPFAAYPDAGLLTTPVFRAWRIESTSDGQQYYTELRLQEGQPLLVRNRLGKGSVISMLSAPQTGNLVAGVEPWNAMAAWPSFVPLVQQIVSSTLSRNAANLNLIAGEPMTGTVPIQTGPGQMSVIRPTGDDSAVQLAEVDASGNQAWSFSQTFESGIYRLRYSNGAIVPYAIGIDSRQSDLLRTPIGLLPRSNIEKNASVELTEAKSEATSSNELSRYVLLGLLVLLLAESTLAWLFGRRLG